MQALTVLEFLIKRGSGQCVEVAQQEISPRLAQLQQFSYVAPDGKDQGINVSHRSALGPHCAIHIVSFPQPKPCILLAGSSEQVFADHVAGMPSSTTAGLLRA